MFNKLNLSQILFIVLLICLISFIFFSIVFYFFYRRKATEPVVTIEPNSPQIIDKLMRKSLELAKTAEQVADQHQKEFLFKENLHL